MTDAATSKHKGGRKKGQRSGVCATCRHPEVGRINYLLVSGSSQRAVAKRFGLSHDCVGRHYRNHITDAQKQDAVRTIFGSDRSLTEILNDANTGAVQEMTYLKRLLWDTFIAAHTSGDATTQSTIGVRIESINKFLCELNGRLQPKPHTVNNTQINVTNLAMSPAFLDLQSRLIAALAPYPAARQAVLECFRDVDAQQALPPPGPRANGGYADVR